MLSITTELLLFAEQTTTPETVPESESAPVDEPSSETQAPETESPVSAVEPEDKSVTPDTEPQNETTGVCFQMTKDCLVILFKAVTSLCVNKRWV